MSREMNNFVAGIARKTTVKSPEIPAPELGIGYAEYLAPVPSAARILPPAKKTKAPVNAAERKLSIHYYFGED